MSAILAGSTVTFSLCVSNITCYDWAYIPRTIAAAVMRSVASVCLSVCPVRDLTFQNLDQETSIFIIYFHYLPLRTLVLRMYLLTYLLTYIFGADILFRISRPSLYIKVIGSRSRLQEQVTGILYKPKYTHIRFRIRLKSDLVFAVFDTLKVLTREIKLFWNWNKSF